jgi:hypothetical protein
MNNIYCSKLLFSVNPLIPEFDMIMCTKSHTRLPVSKINPEMKKILNDIGIYINHVELFYRQPNNIGGIHVDETGGDFTKINWVYGGKDSKMVWCTILPDIEKNIISETIANTFYVTYTRDEVDIAYYTEMQGPYLVQVGVPHYVINPIENRYCLCFVLTNANGNRLTMEDSRKILSKYIID